MAAQSATHPTPQSLHAFCLGKLDEANAETVLEHVCTCDQCRGQLYALARLDLPPELARDTQHVVLRELGRGGMGVVYLARHRLSKRLEVLKVMNRELIANQENRNRFLREIQSAARLDHPNVVKMLTASELGEVTVLVMEYVEGEDLANCLKRGPLPVPKACYYAHQAALGLQEAHEHKLVHRDIKPQNLIVIETAKKHLVKILDFGLAKVVSESRSSSELTGTGITLGTPHYMAPEQATNAAKADIRADIYSLGCTLYHMLAGTTPFTGESAFEVMLAHRDTEARSIAQNRLKVSAELAAVVGRMMAKEPEDRLQTPAEVAQALAPFIKAARESKSAGSNEATMPEPPGADAGRAAHPEAFDTTPSASQTPPDSRKSFPRRDATQANRPPELWKLLLTGTGIVFGFLLLVAGVYLNDPFLVQQKPQPPGEKVAGDPPPQPPSGKEKLDSRKVAEDRNPKGGAKIERPIKPYSGESGKHLVNSFILELGEGVKMEFVLVKAGSFMMGSPESDKDAREDEKPQHEVTISRDFYLCKYPVTQEQYEAVTGSKPSYFSTTGGGKDAVAGLETSRFPVEQVSWEDARKFCELLKGKDARIREFRLPTEAEWEYACRAGSKTPYYLGADAADLEAHAWFDKNSDGRTHEVGTRQPNVWKLYDMAGNVWQWCQDVYDEGFYAKSDVTDPLCDPPGKGARVLRGGSWYDFTRSCRSANRSWLVPDSRIRIYGFRLAAVPSSGGALFMEKVAEDRNPKGGTKEIPPTKQLSGASGNLVENEFVLDLGKDVKMEFVLIKAGSFMMGSPESDGGAYQDEKPQHQVTISRDFYLGKYPVTQEQYEAVTGAKPSYFSATGGGKDKVVGLDTARFPVEQVSWEDAKKFCELLKGKDARIREFRLPTEAEWEYACRAESKTPYYFGADATELANHAWFAKSSDGRTHEVGTRQPNGWKLYDMAGNVWQWCLDGYEESFYAKGDVTDPLCDPQGKGACLLRGGSWSGTAKSCRSAIRGGHFPGLLDQVIGFRLAAVPSSGGTP